MSKHRNTLATILAHPSSPHPVLRDPREQAVADPDAAAESVGRLHFDLRSMTAPDRDEQLRRINGIDLVQRLMDEFGAADVLRWARYAAHSRGHKE